MHISIEDELPANIIDGKLKQAHDIIEDMLKPVVGVFVFQNCIFFSGFSNCLFLLWSFLNLYWFNFLGWVSWLFQEATIERISLVDWHIERRKSLYEWNCFSFQQQCNAVCKNSALVGKMYFQYKISMWSLKNFHIACWFGYCSLWKMKINASKYSELKDVELLTILMSN